MRGKDEDMDIDAQTELPMVSLKLARRKFKKTIQRSAIVRSPKNLVVHEAAPRQRKAKFIEELPSEMTVDDLNKLEKVVYIPRLGGAGPSTSNAGPGASTIKPPAVLLGASGIASNIPNPQKRRVIVEIPMAPHKRARIVSPPRPTAISPPPDVPAPQNAITISTSASEPYLSNPLCNRCIAAGEPCTWRTANTAKATTGSEKKLGRKTKSCELCIIKRRGCIVDTRSALAHEQAGIGMEEEEQEHDSNVGDLHDEFDLGPWSNPADALSPDAEGASSQPVAVQFSPSPSVHRLLGDFHDELDVEPWSNPVDALSPDAEGASSQPVAVQFSPSPSVHRLLGDFHDELDVEPWSNPVDALSPDAEGASSQPVAVQFSPSSSNHRLPPALDIDNESLNHVYNQVLNGKEQMRVVDDEVELADGRKRTRVEREGGEQARTTSSAESLVTEFREEGALYSLGAPWNICIEECAVRPEVSRRNLKGYRRLLLGNDEWYNGVEDEEEEVKSEEVEVVVPLLLETQPDLSNNAVQDNVIEDTQSINNEHCADVDIDAASTTDTDGEDDIPLMALVARRRATYARDKQRHAELDPLSLDNIVQLEDCSTAPEPLTAYPMRPDGGEFNCHQCWRKWTGAYMQCGNAACAEWRGRVFPNKRFCERCIESYDGYDFVEGVVATCPACEGICLCAKCEPRRDSYLSRYALTSAKRNRKVAERFVGEQTDKVTKKQKQKKQNRE
ncbi:hypothetical protein BDZ89DRAFT_1061226 [Hymenopellis radicata]|nr:hypothetical protein BDZ89DRAFT_1061226 [Hymenopellis radicata]